MPRLSVRSNPPVFIGLCAVLLIAVLVLAHGIFGSWGGTIFAGIWCVIFELLYWNILNRRDDDTPDKPTS